MSLFGGAFTPSAGFDQPPRTNFDSIADSMLTVFVIISGENWNDVWADTAAAAGMWSAPYFVLLVIVGNYVVLNLFVAILLGGFSTGIEEPLASGKGLPVVQDHQSEVSLDSNVPMMVPTVAVLEHADADAHRPANGFVVQEQAGSLKSVADHALCCLNVSNPLRRAARAIIDWKLNINGEAGLHSAVSFDNAIVFVILLSCGAMTLESCTLKPFSALASFLEHINIMATGVFTLELVLKVLAHGLICTPNAYLKSGWHRLDATIVIASLLSLLGDSPSLSTLRLLRVLRPLRLIAKFGNLRVVVDLFIKTLPAVANVMLVVCLFAIVFGILGVQLFAGTFSSCEYAQTDYSMFGSAHECIAAGGVWANPALGSFDNIGASMLLLFESSTMEGWPDVMYHTIDATYPGYTPRRNANRAQGLFVVAWVLVGGMFLLNVFVGVIVDEFARIKRLDDGLHMIDEDQQEWVDAMNNLLSLKPRRYPPEPLHDPKRAFIYRVIGHKQFEPVVMSVILLNTVLLGLDGYDDPPKMVRALELGNLICTLFFCVEASAKIYALTFAEYLREPWNVFDFLVATVSIIEESTEAIASTLGMNPSLLRALRTVRVLRIIRTVKAAKGVRVLLTTLLLSLPALYNIASIFFILLTLYSILGMRLFGNIVHGDYLNEYANFCTFPTAMLTMLRCATGESWNGLMHDTMITPSVVYSGSGATVPSCSSTDGTCGSPFASVLFFVSFQVVATFVVLNMMIALILEEYSKALNRDKHRVSADHAELFVETWAQFDPYATGMIHVRHLHALIRRLPPPLGLDPKQFVFGHVRDTDISSYISKLENINTFLNVDTGAPEVSFTEVLNACTSVVYQAVKESVESLSIEAKIVRDLQTLSAQAKASFDRSEAKNNLVELHSVCTIQRRWLASSAARSQRNARAKREAIRLRTPGTLVPAAFEGRVQHSTVAWSGRLFVFGGRAKGCMLRDLWEFSINAGYWVDQSHTVPERLRPRCGHTAMLMGSSRMLIVGGHDGDRFLNDVWECELNGLYWRQVGFSAAENPAKLFKGKVQDAYSDTKSPAPDDCDYFQQRHTQSLERMSVQCKRTPLQEATFKVRGLAATTLQAHARGRAARVAAAWRNALADLEHDAACYMQALW
eukprot:CAMPEP_0115869128 /NCGR_PEP_ID=MMETSP0287-20121206/21651_1 /TAXON_ID=412157 /ORGANISM="Chrysochromulina rotalis, Strain UIO044" /LENGTH=1138 /DNA_ID=CAMNT_0003323809 /DNA_START=89 /DNA_END=3502 /DNA_ORIENTATION=-